MISKTYTTFGYIWNMFLGSTISKNDIRQCQKLLCRQGAGYLPHVFFTTLR